MKIGFSYYHSKEILIKLVTDLLTFLPNLEPDSLSGNSNPPVEQWSTARFCQNGSHIYNSRGLLWLTQCKESLSLIWPKSLYWLGGGGGGNYDLLEIGGTNLVFLKEEISRILRNFNVSQQIFLQYVVVQEQKREEDKIIHFLKALFIAISKINVSRLWLWRYLKYSVPKSRTSRCYTNSLKMNVFFHLSLEAAKILSVWL